MYYQRISMAAQFPCIAQVEQHRLESIGLMVTLCCVEDSCSHTLHINACLSEQYLISARVKLLTLNCIGCHFRINSLLLCLLDTTVQGDRFTRLCALPGHKVSLAAFRFIILGCSIYSYVYLFASELTSFT